MSKMTSLENQKLITEKFIDNAVNNEKNESFNNDLNSESEKLIMDEISTEKPSELVENAIQKTDSIVHPFEAPTDDKGEPVNVETNKDSLDAPEETAGDIDTKETVKNDNNISNLEDVEIVTENSETSKNLENCNGSPENSDNNEEWIDILGSGVIMKKVLKEGELDTKPKRSEKCIINYTCTLDDEKCTFVENAMQFEMSLGEADVVQGLDVAIGLMNKFERSVLKIRPRLAYGEKGLAPNVPSNTTVVYDVELVDVQEEADFDNMTVKTRRAIGNKKRERGNWWYQRGENSLAVQCYRRALDFLDEVENERDTYKPTDSELQQLLDDRLKVLNNMASAHIRMELYDQATASLQTVLRCQPNNVKALYRKAKVHIAKQHLTQALQILEKAKLLDPEEVLITKEIQYVSSLIQKQKSSERDYARRMFGNPSATDNKSKTKSDKSSRRSTNNKFQLWTSLTATVILGLAGFIAYKFKYT